MTPAQVIAQAGAEGLRLALTPVGGLSYLGDEAIVARWLPVLREHRNALLEVLSAPCAACRNLRMAEVQIPDVGARFVWGCSKGHMEHGHGTPDLSHLRAPMACAAAGHFAPVESWQRAKAKR